MFTVRIDHVGPDPQPGRTVYACNGYTVRSAEGDTVLALVMPDGKQEVPLKGGIAYVMNANGVTVDVVRSPQTNRRRPS